MAEVLVVASHDQAEADKIDADCWVAGIKVCSHRIDLDGFVNICTLIDLQPNSY